jgi:hypothetical protein
MDGNRFLRLGVRGGGPLVGPRELLRRYKVVLNSASQFSLQLTFRSSRRVISTIFDSSKFNTRTFVLEYRAEPERRDGFGLIDHGNSQSESLPV